MLDQHPDLHVILPLDQIVEGCEEHLKRDLTTGNRILFESVLALCRSAGYRGDHYNRPNDLPESSAKRMIPDAADAVRTAALHADAMLSEIQTGWLWQFITKKPNPPKA